MPWSPTSPDMALREREREMWVMTQQKWSYIFADGQEKERERRIKTTTKTTSTTIHVITSTTRWRWWKMITRSRRSKITATNNCIISPLIEIFPLNAGATEYSNVSLSLTKMIIFGEHLLSGIQMHFSTVNCNLHSWRHGKMIFFFFFFFLLFEVTYNWRAHFQNVINPLFIIFHFFAQIYASLPCTQSGTSSLINFKLETWTFKDIKMTLFPKRDKSIFFPQNVINPTCSSSNSDWPIREQHCGIFWVTLCVTLCTCMYSCKLCAQIMHTFSFFFLKLSIIWYLSASMARILKRLTISNPWFIQICGLK